MRYGIHPSPFGPCLIGIVDNKLCKLSFNDLQKAQQNADWVRDDKATKPFAAAILSRTAKQKNIPFVLQGTKFQMKVWKAIKKIPFGKTKSYKDIARIIGKPNAVRAVGGACGKNPIGMLIPCHRVIASDGSLGGFGWGLKRKKEMLDWEWNHPHLRP